MKKINFSVLGNEVYSLVPDPLLEKLEQANVLWLIAPEGDCAQMWSQRTAAEEYAETAKAILVCAPGVAEDGFYRNGLWEALQDRFPGLPVDPDRHRLLGLGNSGERCLRFVFSYPEKFRIAVAVSPVSADGCGRLLAAVKAHMEAGKPIPRAVIADCSEGDGRSIGEAINAYGVGLHVHGERPVSGWDLMDMEIKSCLAHLQ